jgi:hypothetical protein
MPWTVISYDDDTGQVMGDWVMAQDQWEAFAVARGMRSDVLTFITFVAAVPGHVTVDPPTETGVVCAAVDYPDWTVPA